MRVTARKIRALGDKNRRARPFFQRPVKARLSAVIGFLSLLSLVIGLFGLYGMNQANEMLKTV
ncbi:Tar ligand binding domain-containing protein [Massilia varians]